MIADIERRLEEGTLIRHKWEYRDSRGRHLACLWFAYAQGQDGIDPTNPSACPSHLMPAWWARMTPWFGDRGSEAAWPGMVRKWVACAKRWRAFRPADWDRFSRRVRAIILREARSHCPADATDVLAVIDRVLGLLARDDATAQEYEAAAVCAARAAASAARVVRTVAASAAWASAAEAAAAAWAVEAAWAWAAEASDRMAAAILDEMSAMLDRCEARNAAELAGGAT